ncbi:unnamed protein product, partial [Bubo scandiacus]
MARAPPRGGDSALGSSLFTRHGPPGTRPARHGRPGARHRGGAEGGRANGAAQRRPHARSPPQPHPERRRTPAASAARGAAGRTGRRRRGRVATGRTPHGPTARAAARHGTAAVPTRRQPPAREAGGEARASAPKHLLGLPTAAPGPAGPTEPAGPGGTRLRQAGAPGAGSFGALPESPFRGTKALRPTPTGLRGAPAAPLRPPPARPPAVGGEGRQTGRRLIVKRRSDRRSPGRNPGPQVRSKNGYTPNGKGRGARAPHRPGEKQAPCSLRRRPRRPGSARPPHGGPRRARPRPACPPLARGVGGDGRHTGAARRPGSSGARPAGAARASALRTAGSPRAPTPARPAGNVRAAPPPHHTGPDGPATAGTRDGDAPPPGAPPDRRPATAPQRLPLPGTAAVASRLGPFRRHAPGERRTPLSRGRRPLSPLPRGERDGERPSAAHPPHLTDAGKGDCEATCRARDGTAARPAAGSLRPTRRAAAAPPPFGPGAAPPLSPAASGWTPPEPPRPGRGVGGARSGARSAPLQTRRPSGAAPPGETPPRGIAIAPAREPRAPPPGFPRFEARQAGRGRTNAA